MTKSKLIFKGSSGCIFRPQIQCKKTKRKNKSKTKITKVMFDKGNHEYDFNRIIRGIKNHKKWTVLWEDICESPPYEELLEYTDIDECLENKEDYSRIQPDYSFLLYQGVYGGRTLDDYCKKNISKHVLMDQTKFNKLFIKILRLLKNVFYGLTQLHKHNICHHDINIRNILIKGTKSFIIDYDIALKIKNTEENMFLKKRMLQEITSNRLYEAYPFEYLYYSMSNRKDILSEQENIKSYQNLINYYELYSPIHHSIFDIDTDTLRQQLLEDKLTKNNHHDLDKLIGKLDVYSLGVMILIPFLDAGVRLNIPIKVITDRFHSGKLESYMDLIKDMISFNYQDRITPDEAYQRYLNLIR